jgi:entericidin A
MMKKLLILLALSSGMVLSACNTIHGAAKDVKSVGDCADGRPGNC